MNASAKPAKLVVGAAIVRDGRVLATRRTKPPQARGLWELPGGKVELGERPHDALVREIREELGCVVRVTGTLDGREPVGDGYALQVLRAELVCGEPTPHEHDALLWLGPDELDSVTWLSPDVPFLAQVRALLRRPAD
jgi:8-oxo-dGTP diphosphatase